MNKTLVLALVVTPSLAIQAPASQQNKSVKPPQENTDSQESIRSLLRQKDRKSPPRKVAKPKKGAPQQVSPTSRKDTIQPSYHDYPLLRQKDEKAPVEKNQ
jgi:phage I-like protein